MSRTVEKDNQDLPQFSRVYSCDLMKLEWCHGVHTSKCIMFLQIVSASRGTRRRRAFSGKTAPFEIIAHFDGWFAHQAGCGRLP